MNIVFVSNYFNHHQKAFCEAMYREKNIDFTFIATSTMREERKKLGYTIDCVPEYVLCSYESSKNMDSAKKLIFKADVVIAGSAPENMLRKRILSGKLVFRYSERPFKRQKSPLEMIKFYLYEHIKNFPFKNVYMLCASAYTASDYGKIGMFKNKAFKWGYFPQQKKYVSISDIISNKTNTSILWCGRFLDWKHPDDVLLTAVRLKNDGYKFKINFIGTGELEDKLKFMAKEYEIDDCVQFLGSMHHHKVRENMEQSGIYLMTSDRNEGWGAVLNEAMNSGCAVVASNEAGAAPYLVKDGENGLLYTACDIDMLYIKLKYLLDNPNEQRRLGEHAYQTIIDDWNANVAVTRFLKLVKSLESGVISQDLFKSGLCSLAY